jgi:hypothetical protein
MGAARPAWLVLQGTQAGRAFGRRVTLISALVIYLDGNEAGSGFYKLAQDLGELPPGRLSAHVKDQFWTRQVRRLFEYYGSGFVGRGNGADIAGSS